MVDLAESGLSKKFDLKAGFGWMLLFTCILMWFCVAFHGMKCVLVFFLLFLAFIYQIRQAAVFSQVVRGPGASGLIIFLRVRLA